MRVWRLFDAVRAAIGGAPGADPVPLGAHFHNSRGTGIASAFAAVQAGVTQLDASVGGLGGCPFAPGASGNIATEELVYLLDDAGISTGVDLTAVLQAAAVATELVGHPLESNLFRAGGRNRPRTSSLIADRSGGPPSLAPAPTSRRSNCSSTAERRCQLDRAGQRHPVRAGGRGWTKDVHRAHRVAGAIRAGTVWINAYRVVTPNMPFGGFGSGIGRENGTDAINEYLETKSVLVELTGGTRDPFKMADPQTACGAIGSVSSAGPYRPRWSSAASTIDVGSRPCNA